MAITIQLSGFFGVRNGCRRLPLGMKGATLNLFAFLALNGNKSFSRDFVSEAIWPEKEPTKAKSTLSTAIWRINQFLKKTPGLKINCSPEFVRLDIRDQIYVDVRHLEASLSDVREHHSDVESLRRAVENCRPELLSGLSEAWLLSSRECHSLNYIQALTHLMHHEASNGHYDKAIALGSNILAVDFFRETTQREVMWLYFMSGQRAKAIYQYMKLRDILYQELQIDPMPETQALFQQISSTSSSQNSPFYVVDKTTQKIVPELTRALDRERASVLKILSRQTYS